MALPATRTNYATNPGIAYGGGGTSILRTNLATNAAAASTTNFAAVAGTGGTAALTNQTTAGHTGNDFNRVTWSAATTAISGGLTYTQTGLAASTAYALSLWVKCNKAQTVTLTATFQTSASATVNTVTSSAVALPAGQWTQVFVTGTSGAAVDRVVLGVNAATGGALWAVNDTLDADDVLIVTGTVQGPDFNGSTPASGDFTYAWAGAANASVSYMQGIGPVNVTGSPGTGGLIMTYRSSAGSPGVYFGRVQWVSPASTGGSAGVVYTESLTGSAGDVFSARASVRMNTPKSIALLFRFRNGSTVVGTVTTAYQTPAANTWTEFVADGLAATGAYTNIQVYMIFASAVTSAAGDTLDMDGILIEKAAVSGQAFDGSTTTIPDRVARWTGPVNLSTSTLGYYGVYVEQNAGAGMPTVQVYVAGLGTAVACLTKVQRTAGRETWTVPGWRGRNTLDSDTSTDYIPPLGVPTTYTLFVNGQAVSSKSITVTSATGWVLDPVQPDAAMPVAIDNNNMSMLSLAHQALKTITRKANSSRARPVGSRYEVAMAGQRGGASAVEFVLNAQTNAVSDQFVDLIEDAGVLLFRTLPSWGTLPPLAYVDGDFEETPFNRARGGGFTQHIIKGDLVAPVSRAPVTGIVTNTMVANNLVGRTNASIAAASGGKTNVAIKANPLGLGS